ncbi:MAG: hypothetical protein ABI980_06720, partial [Nitrospirota bacterium]
MLLIRSGRSMVKREAEGENYIGSLDCIACIDGTVLLNRGMYHAASQAIAEKEKEAFEGADLSRDPLGTPPRSMPNRRWQGVTPFLKWLALTVGVLLLLALGGLWMVNRELPPFIERELNAHVTGYRFTVKQASLSPILSLE